MSREPETEAGRDLIDRHSDGAVYCATNDASMHEAVLAIEAEVRASLAALVKFELNTSRVPSDHPLVDIRRRVLALIEGSDPASPEPCGNDEWDSRYACVLPKGHPTPGGATLEGHDYQLKADEAEYRRSREASPAPVTPPHNPYVRALIETYAPVAASEPPTDEVTRIAVRLPPGGLTLAFGGTALEAAQALYDAGLRVEPRSLSEPLDELRALSEAATPGPWRYHRSIFPPSGKINYAYVSFGKDDGENGLGTGTLSEADARFIAAAVKYVRVRLATDPSAPEQTDE